MEHIFKDIAAKHWAAWVGLGVAVIAMAAVVFNPLLTDFGKGALVLLAYSGLVVFMWRSLLLAAHLDHRHLLTVCIWSFVMLALGIAALFYSYMHIISNLYPALDKLLNNLVPVLVAIWAAAVGWLIHFKLTTKAHRTNNAFAIIMEMRKNSEIIKRLEIVSYHFPPGSGPIPQSYVPFFAPDALTKARNAAAGAQANLSQIAKLQNGAPKEGFLRNASSALDTANANVEKAEAIQALKFVLNYYEFMAVGIKAGDLDGDLLFSSISTAVIRLFDRAKAYIDFASDEARGGHPDTFCDLKRLSAEWKSRDRNGRS
ncbi:DUF4760 domain-containing protein [Pseudomonas sp. CGJS7]|uniref:DUF4760 domain-containing protein n=1 Tax=Pseudomonas sp. CGJS7 TaxID=3109348 RepID=UPI003008821F